MAHYTLRANFIESGFKLYRDGNKVFKTSHRFGFLPSSWTKLGPNNIAIKLQNFHEGRFDIIKDGETIGGIVIEHYRAGYINLLRPNGRADLFKLSEDAFTRNYVLSQSSTHIMRFITPLVTLDPFEPHRVELLSRDFTPLTLEELMLYCGEILFRRSKGRAYS